MSPAPYPILVLQYPIQGHKRRNEHWALAVLTAPGAGRLYQLAGNEDTFACQALDFMPHDAQRSCGACQVGALARDRVAWLEARLHSIPVRRQDAEYDCQIWTVHALRQLREDGVVFVGMDERALRSELRKERELWEVAEDILMERRFIDSL